MKKSVLLLLVYLLFANTIFAQKPGYTVLKIEPIDTQRVAEIAAMLPNNPKGFGDPIALRKRWDVLYKSGQFNALLKEADSISRKPFPKLTDSIYLEYYKGKDSETSKRFIMKRRMLLTKMVWAECLTNKGKYLPAILNAVSDILNTTSWSFPAEDRNKTNYLGKMFTINLSSSAYGYDMAQTLFLLNSKLSDQLKKQILDVLYQKVFNPTIAAIKNNNANQEFESLTSSGNHNSATMDGVIGAALAAIKDKKERAVFAAIAERYSNNFLVGYLDDGYCTEGVGYYTYGFGHYLMMREHIWQATNGKVDLLNRPKVKKMAAFAPNMEIVNGVYAAIGDCEQYIRPGQQVMYYVNKNFDLGLKAYDTFSAKDIEQPSLSNLLYFFPNTASQKKALDNSSKMASLRHYFEKAGVLTVRPAPGAAVKMGATLKGGNNAEHHNHNDIGSFTIAVDNELLMGDAGLATYTPKYFTTQRYELYKTTASYGHDVPLVAGVQQRVGKEAQAKIIKTDFSDGKDVFAMDISSGYLVPGLQKLLRTFTYNRTGNSTLEVKDEFSFTSAQSFETALITRYTWKKLGADEIEISGKKQKLKVKILAPENSFEISDEIINEGPKPYTRIAIKLKANMPTGSLIMVFTPGGNTTETTLK